MFSLGIINRLNAEAAKKKAKAAREKGPEIKHLLERVYEFIERAADKGATRLDVNPLEGLRCIISDEQRAAVWRHVRNNGYRVNITGKRFLIRWD